MRYSGAQLHAMLAFGVCSMLACRAAEQSKSVDTAQLSPSTQSPVPRAHMPGWGGPPVVERGTEITWSPRTLLDSAMADVDRDGTPERVELYAAVARDRRGRLMFDDGQRWALLVRDSTNVYPLFDGFIQLGRIDFWVVMPSDSSAAILLSQRTPNGLLLQKYVFDGRRRAFISTGAVEALGNVLHRPAPDSAP